MTATTDEAARRVAIHHAVDKQVDAIQGEYQLLPSVERLQRLDSLIEELGMAMEDEDIRSILVDLAAEPLAWLTAIEVEEAR